MINMFCLLYFKKIILYFSSFRVSRGWQYTCGAWTNRRILLPGIMRRIQLDTSRQFVTKGVIRYVALCDLTQLTMDVFFIYINLRKIEKKTISINWMPKEKSLKLVYDLFENSYIFKIFIDQGSLNGKVDIPHTFI